MAQLTLPKNSTIDKKAGKHFKAPAGAKKVRSFKIYRYDPDTGRASIPMTSTWPPVARWFSTR
jgi:hypothetical protein